jgi:hypothetical protein
MLVLFKRGLLGSASVGAGVFSRGFGKAASGAASEVLAVGAGVSFTELATKVLGEIGLIGLGVVTLADALVTKGTGVVLVSDVATVALGSCGIAGGESCRSAGNGVSAGLLVATNGVELTAGGISV